MYDLRQKSGILTFSLLSLMPFFIWLIIKPLSARFGDVSTILTSIGQVTGILGMSTLTSAVIMSSRLVFLDKIFGGLDKLYICHRWFGAISFLLLLAHPLFLSFAYLPFSGFSAALFLLPDSDWAKNFGIISLLVMMALMASATLFLKFKYEILKSIHKLFGTVFIFAVLHTFLIPSEVSRNVFLKWYVILFSAFGLLAFSYKTLLGGLLVKKYSYFVKEINKLSANTVEIVMRPGAEPMKYFAGQFVFLSFCAKKISSEIHPFSIASSSYGQELKVLVKSLGDFTAKVAELPINCLARIEGPFGRLSYSVAKGKNQVWIAGGVGIAPFLGMARDLRQPAARGYNIDLYYCAPSESELVCSKELSEIKPLACRFQFIPFCQDKKGFLNAEKISEISGDLKDKEIFLCGPPLMLKSLKGQFSKMKIPRVRIHSEEFKLF